jgi:integrase
MLRTKSGLPKHCGWNTDHHGKRRVRFRKGGFSIYIVGTPWGEDFMRQYAAALDGVKAQQTEIGSARTKPGSFDALCVSYFRSPDFRGLRPSTQMARRNIIEPFRAVHGTKPLKGLRREHIEAVIGAKSDKPEAANHLLKTLRVMLSYAVSSDMLDSNPAATIKKYRSQGEGHHSWSESEIAQFEARHQIGSKARLALALGLYTAQRKSDVLRMGWQHVSGDAIAVRQQKTDTALLIPMHPHLVAALASAPRGNLTFLMTEHGAPFTPMGFSNWWRARCNEAGLPHCSFHGLRKAAATRLANAGCTVDQVKAITGHKSLAEVARYTRAVDQHRLARQAIEKLKSETEGEQKLSNPVPRFVQPGSK